MTNPLVSICIPVYNGMPYLRECLESCVNQDYQNFEIVISDDGSTDGSVSLIEEFSKAYTNIRFYKNETNPGLVENWNRCLDIAKGEWIKFVFQDDFLSRKCLSEFVKAIKPTISFYVCARNFILPENASANLVNYYTCEVRTLENTSIHKENFFSPELISTIAAQNIAMNFIGEPSLIFFKKSVSDELGVFNDALKQICDLEFALRVSSKYGLLYLPEKLCAFRIHTNSTTTTNLRRNYFQLHYIEPLLFSWFLLYDKRYMAFRSHLSVFLTLKLNLYFQLKCYQAYKVNLKNKQDHHVFRESHPQFKEIHQYKRGTPWIRVLAVLRK